MEIENNASTLAQDIICDVQTKWSWSVRALRNNEHNQRGTFLDGTIQI